MSISSSRETTMYRWTARIRCNDQELRSSFSVLIFIGDVPDDPEDWSGSPSYAGVFSVFTSSDEPPGDDGEPEITVQGFVQLNNAILKNRYLGSPSLEPDVVVPYLTRNIQWRVQKVDDTVVTLKSLEVEVLATQPAGKPHVYNSITYGRPGGSRSP